MQCRSTGGNAKLRLFPLIFLYTSFHSSLSRLHHARRVLSPVSSPLFCSLSLSYSLELARSHCRPPLWYGVTFIFSAFSLESVFDLDSSRSPGQVAEPCVRCCRARSPVSSLSFAALGQVKQPRSPAPPHREARGVVAEKREKEGEQCESEKGVESRGALRDAVMR